MYHIPLSRVAPSPSTCGEVCRRLDHEESCGNLAARDLRSGLRQRAEDPSILGVTSLRRGETSRWRAYVQARFIARCGASCLWWSAKFRGRRLGVERYGDVAAAVERGSGTSPAVDYGIQEAMPTLVSMLPKYYLHNLKPRT
jgi:hypothetical protein